MLGFLSGSGVKNPPVNAGDTALISVRKIPWRRKWQTTPVFLPRKHHGTCLLHGVIVKHYLVIKQWQHLSYMLTLVKTLKSYLFSHLLFYLLVKCVTIGVSNWSQDHRVNLFFRFDSDSSEDTQYLFGNKILIFKSFHIC